MGLDMRSGDCALVKYVGDELLVSHVWTNGEEAASLRLFKLVLNIEADPTHPLYDIVQRLKTETS